MKRKVYLLLVCAMCAVAASAQVVKGDMNDDGKIDVADLNETVNTMLGMRDIQYVSGGGDPYMVDNNLVVGTWYRTKSEHFTLNADGTTDYVSEHGTVATYEFLPYQGTILFYDKSDKPVSWIEVKKLMPGRMICNFYDLGDDLYVLTTEQPEQKVTGIELSQTEMHLTINEYSQLPSVTVLPDDADNKAVTWSNSDENVVKVVGDLVLAAGTGTAVLTCTAQDGSGVTATCNVTVKPKDQSGQDASGRKYVDLGLPSGTLWATTNVGATKDEDYGLYFAWGETKGYAKGESHTFNWSNYKWCNGSASKMTKYSTSTSYWDSSLGTSPDNKTVLDSDDDAATANWGSGWQMPSLAQIKELYNSSYTTTEWTTMNGVNGRKITSKSNGNSIFLPAEGYRYDTSLDSEGSNGFYWSRELHSSYSGFSAHSLNFHSGNVGTSDYGRYGGQSIRAVRVPSK